MKLAILDDENRILERYEDVTPEDLKNLPEFPPSLILYDIVHWLRRAGMRAEKREQR